MGRLASLAARKSYLADAKNTPKPKATLFEEIRRFDEQLGVRQIFAEPQKGVLGVVQLILCSPETQVHERVIEATEYVEGLPAEQQKDTAELIVNFLKTKSGNGTNTYRDEIVLELERTEDTPQAARIVCDKLSQVIYQFAGRDTTTMTQTDVEVQPPILTPSAGEQPTVRHSSFVELTGGRPSRPMSEGTGALIANGGREEVVGGDSRSGVDTYTAPTAQFSVQPAVESRTGSSDGIAIATPGPPVDTRARTIVTLPAVDDPEGTTRPDMPSPQPKAPKSGKGLIVGAIITIATIGALAIGSITYAVWPSSRSQTQNQAASGNAAVVQPKDGLGAQLPSVPVLNSPGSGTATPGTAAPPVEVPRRTEGPTSAGTGSPTPGMLQALAEPTAPPEQVQPQPKPVMTRPQINELRGAIGVIVKRAIGEGVLAKRPGGMNMETGAVTPPSPIVVEITENGHVGIKGSTKPVPDALLGEIGSAVDTAIDRTSATLPTTGQRFSY